MREARSVSFEEVLLRFLDSAATAPAWSRQGGTRPLRALLAGRNRAERVHGGLALLDRMAPGAARALSRRLTRSRQLALAVDGIELLGFGGGATVFRCETPVGPRVLKVFRRSLGRPLDEQRAVAAYYAERHRTVAGWYERVPGLVVPTAFLILPGPFLGRPVAAAVQPLVEGPLRCFFADQDDDTALARLGSDRALALQFQGFARRTLEAYAREGRCLDLVGRENLMLVETGGRARLAIADCGILDAAGLERDAPARAQALAERIGRLESLLGRLGTPG
jgi:hypothetical protein